MAVLPMQRISICGLKQDRKQILEELQRQEVIELNDCLPEDSVFQKSDVRSVVDTLTKRAQLAQNALAVLDTFVPLKQGILGILNGKLVVSRKEYQEFYHNCEEAYEISNKLLQLSKKISENKAEILRLNTMIEALEPWISLDLPLSFSGTKSTTVFIGTLPGAQEEQLKEALKEVTLLTINVISVIKEQTCIFVLCHNDEKDKVYETLRNNGFARPVLQSDIIPKKQKQDYEEKITELQIQIKDSEDEIIKLGNKRELLRFYSDYETMREEKYEAIGRLLQSEHIFILTGYIAKRDVESIRSLLESAYDVVIVAEDPSEDEDVPVQLHNNGFARPLESVTESYSPPGKGEMDPTMVMSLFYYALFGIMFSDAGYGLILATLCGLALLKGKNMKKSIKEFLQMFFFCGISTLFWGIIFSSYFGDAVTLIASTFFGKDVVIPPVWFSPNEKPMQMLVFSMVLGIIHIYTGLGMKLYQNIKNGQWKDGLYDVVFWYITLTSCILILLSSKTFMDILGLNFILPSSVAAVAKVLAVIFSIAIIATAGRESRNPFKRFLKGLYGFYGISGYLGDVLSYSRLLALGLATGIIGTVINKMGAMAGSGIAKVIIFIVVFALGHSLNFAINILGAYVHTNRLQYVEFFGKFYEGGGRKFNPFRANTKYYEVKGEK